MKILIADDHALFREGMRHVLKQLTNDVEIVEASDCTEALAAVDAPDRLGSGSTAPCRCCPFSFSMLAGNTGVKS